MQPFFVTAANALAFQAVEACLRGDDAFRLVLLLGPRGSGKSALVRWAKAKAAAEADGRGAPAFEDPVAAPPRAGYPEGTRIVATLDPEAPFADELVARFRNAGGHVVSTVIEPELTEAVARDLAARLPLAIDDEAIALLVDKLRTPSVVAGALSRLKAEAALAGRERVDAVFVIRSLGPFLFPSR